MDSPLVALFLSIMTIRDLPPEQRAAVKQMFDHYVFEATEAKVAHIPKNVRRMHGDIDAERARDLRGQLLQRLNR
jgi:hypothetical protein